PDVPEPSDPRQQQPLARRDVATGLISAVDRDELAQCARIAYCSFDGSPAEPRRLCQEQRELGDASPFAHHAFVVDRVASCGISAGSPAAEEIDEVLRDAFGKE